MIRTGVRGTLLLLQVTVAGILGALSSWSLAFFYSLLDVERGYLAVPFGIVLMAGVLIWRRPQFRPVALALLVGAAAETLFFVWLFTDLSRGL